MRAQEPGLIMALGVGLLWATTTSAGPTAAQRCEAEKLKRAGMYSACRLKAESAAVKKGTAPDYTKCDEKIAERFGAAEAKFGAECPTSGDLADIQSQVTADADVVAAKLAGARFVDNGDGTVTDLDTALMWEQKDDLAGIHDKDDTYTWSSTGTAPDGTAFTGFLALLNNGQSSNGSTVSGCFAGHCDWRLPTITELQSILLAPHPCATDPCIDPIFGPTKPFGHWSTTTHADFPTHAWIVQFVDGTVAFDVKIFGDFGYVRAVRSVS